MDKIKGFKTVLFNVIMTAIMLTGMWGGDVLEIDEEDVVSTLDALEAAIVGIWGVGNIMLRAVTNSPIFNKG